MIIRCVVTLVLSCLVIGCATTPEQAAQRAQVQRDVEAILTQPIDAAEYSETKSCLSANEYRDFRALDDRYLLFEGRGDRLWINKLFARCPDLRHATVLRVRSISSMGRICKMESFQPGDWFDWPWYRRAPWRWGSRWNPGMANCSLGEFQAVTAAQVEALERALSAK